MNVFGQDKNIYNDGVIYNETGIAMNFLGCTYESIGRTTFDQNNKKTIQQVKRILGFIPTTSICFLYNGCKYYIPIYDDLLSFGCFNSMKKGDYVILELLYIEGCVDNKQPFAIVRNVLRGTQRYCDLLMYSYHPECLKDIRENSIFISFLVSL